MKNICVFLLLLIFSTASFARPDFRIVTLNNSKHYIDTDDAYNERHGGIGVEYEIARHKWIGYTTYTNSFRQRSQLVTFGTEEKLKKGFYTGSMFGIADGYGDPGEDEGYVALLGFTARYKYFRVVFTPTVAFTGLVLEF